MKLNDIKEGTDHSDENYSNEWADAVTAGINRVGDLDLSKLENFPDEGSDYFYKVAAAIVEPPGLSDDANDAYGNFIDIGTDKWVSWIKSNFDEDWGKIAELVDENGY